MGWEHYKKLIVWQKAMELTTEIYRLTKLLPKEEVYSLSMQMKRAAVSIPSNIAEGHGRKTNQEFYHFLSIARGSCYELETQLLICDQLGFLNKEKEKSENALHLCDEISRMITSMISKYSASSDAEGESPNSKLQTPKLKR